MSQHASRAPLRRAERTTLTQQVAHELLDMIRSGRYKPGERLPTESDLVTQMGVGRSCVREAMQWLTMAGAVDVRPRRGAIVRRIDAERLNVLTSFPSLLEYEVLVELNEVRRLPEPEVPRLAAERITLDGIETLHACLRRLDDALESDGLDALVATDDDFHNAVASAANNLVLRKMMHGVHDLLIESRRVGLRARAGIEHARNGHRRIYEAISRRDPAAAREAMRTHLEESHLDLQEMQPSKVTPRQTRHAEETSA